MISPIHAEQGDGLPGNAGHESAAPVAEAPNRELHQTWNLICWVDPEVLLNELEEAGKELPDDVLQKDEIIGGVRQPQEAGEELRHPKGGKGGGAVFLICQV